MKVNPDFSVGPGAGWLDRQKKRCEILKLTPYDEKFTTDHASVESLWKVQDIMKNKDNQFRNSDKVA